MLNRTSETSSEDVHWMELVQELHVVADTDNSDVEPLDPITRGMVGWLVSKVIIPTW
jgi:hypothetical protein